MERTISPGVFTNEIDLSFLPAGIEQIGAALIGSTVKGPAYVPTIVDSWANFEQVFGSFDEKMYTPYTAKGYLKNAGRATIVRVLGLDGYSLSYPLAIVATGSWGSKLVNFLHPTFVSTDADSVALFNKSTLAANESGSFVLRVSGSFTTDTSDFTGATAKNGTAVSCSIDPESADYIGDIYGYNPEGIEPVYNYVNFGVFHSESLASDAATSVLIETGSASNEWDFTDEYQPASTPWITSQTISSAVFDLIKFHTLSHGTPTNFEFKIGIGDIKAAGTIAGSEYGSFTVVLRAVDQDKIPKSPYTYEDSDTRPLIVESFDNCNLDPDSANFVARKIGDKYITVDSDGKVRTNGDYSNKSKHFRVEVKDSIKRKAYSPTLIPFGFRSPYSPIPTGFTAPPSASYVADQQIGGIYNSKKYWGFNYDFTNTDNLNYLRPLPVSANLNTGSNSDFYLGDYSQDADANYPTAATAYSGSIDLTTNIALSTKKFLVPFQGGFDGWRPHLQKKVGSDITTTNTQGFDLSTTSATGYTAYKRAILAVSNPDEFDINMIVLPGVLHQYHSAVTTYAKDMVEDRGDAFYVMDDAGLTQNIQTAVDTVEQVDSSYAATYHPWVKIIDTNKNKPVWVPPSVVLPGIIAYTDKVAHEWFAPAGLNRGGLTEVVEVYERLTHADRDTLYEGRVNPIATFPGQGAVVWGQKTLQAKPSSLDRVNVRRLLIKVKKFIAGVGRLIVFEQNVSVTRSKFSNVVNPYLESVQSRQGLYSFKLILDETINSAEIVDRNQIKAQLFLQPAKTAEFIIIDLILTPTGATFS